MTNRKNIKVNQETFDDLQEEKGRFETWDGFFQRVLGELGGGDEDG